MNNAFRSLNMAYNLKMLLLVGILYIFYYNCPYKKPDKPGHKNYVRYPFVHQSNTFFF